MWFPKSQSGRVSLEQKCKSEFLGSEMVRSGGQTQSKKAGAKKEPKPDRPDRLMATLEAVQSDIAVLKEAVNSQNAPDREKGLPRRPFQNQRRRVCPGCQRANQDFCDHCFSCGSSDHFARECRKGATTTPDQGNRRRLQPRDRE